MYHGGGGFKHEEVYNMPTWMRKFHLKKIQKFFEEQEEELKKQKQQGESPSNAVQRPNIPNSSTYNFKK